MRGHTVAGDEVRVELGVRSGLALGGLWSKLE